MAGGNSNHIRAYAVLRGGIAVHNPRSDPAVPGGAFGTLGLIATSDGTDRWAVSCYHVLCRKGEAFPVGAIEPVYHPFSVLNPTPIALMTEARADRALDCAAAQMLHPEACTGEVLGLGDLAAPIEPKVGMRLIKSGAETGVTEGRIVRVTADEMEIAPVGLPDEYDLSEGGDSGAVWVDGASRALVGLHYRGNERGTPERAFARPMSLVFASLKLRLVG